MKRFFSLLIGFLLILSLTSSANAILLTNGSFETPEVTGHGGKWQLFNDASVPGWGTMSPMKVEYQTSSLFGPAADGNQYVELDSNKNDGNQWLVQGFSSIVGMTYELEFAFSARPGVELNLLQLTGMGEGSLFDTTLSNVDGRGLSGTDWTYHTLSFVANSDFTLIGFKDAGDDDSYGSFIDDVSVAPVPEPATMLLFGLGLLSFAGISRKRLKQ